MSELPSFVSTYDPFDIMGITAATTVTGATTKLTVTITPSTDEAIFLFNVQGFYDGASTGVGIIYDGTTKIGQFALGNHVGLPWESKKGVKLDGNLVILVPAGAAGSGHLSCNYKSAIPPETLFGAR